MPMMRQLLLTLLSMALLCVSSASASPIAIFSTGVDGSGNPLSAGSADPHWTLNSTTAYVVSNPTGLGWIANPTNAQWISANSGGLPDVGTFAYTTTFDLTGLDLSGVTIVGNIAVDDSAQVFLNGVDILGDNVALNNAAWSYFVPFTINSGFVQGVNTLSVSTYNVGGPGGLLFQIESATTPEPGTLGMLLIGSLAGLAGALRRGWRPF